MSMNSAFRVIGFFTSSTLYGGRQWPPNVKTQTQKSIFKVKSENQNSKVNFQLEKSKSKIKSRLTMQAVDSKKSIFNLKSRYEMSISEARKSSFDNSLLPFDFWLWPPPYPPTLNFFSTERKTGTMFACQIMDVWTLWTTKRRLAVS